MRKRIVEPELKEYVGKISALRGSLALVRKANGSDFPDHVFDYSCTVMAQFDEPTIYDGKMMHLGWHPFASRDFKALENGKKVF